MEIQRETLRELQYLQEDIAAYFTDEHVVSGETYWTCVESVAIAKLAELRGEPLYYEKLKEILDAMIASEDEEESKWAFNSKKVEKKILAKNWFKTLFDGGSTKDLRVEGVPSLSFVINKTEEKI